MEIKLVIFIIITVLAAFYLKALTKSGALAAFFVGLGVAIGFGLSGLIILGSFFVSSSILSKVKSSEKKPLENLLEKSDERDWQQVLANGGTAAICGILFYFYDSELFLLAFLISLASNTSDTWASEIGVLSKSDPLSLKTFERVPAGTSGAISTLGTAMALAGSLFVSLLAYVIAPQITFKMTITVIIFGFVGNVIDTLLGAFSQVKYFCPECGIKTERTNHCNQATTQISGQVLINNEVVNFSSSLLATLIGVFIFYLL